MAMSEMTLWPIVRPLFLNGWITKLGSKFEMTMENPSLSLAHQICIHSSLSHMTNQHSFKMTKGRCLKTIKIARQPLNQKAKGSP